MEIKREITSITFMLNEIRNIILPALDAYTDRIIAETVESDYDFWDSAALDMEQKLREALTQTADQNGD